MSRIGHELPLFSSCPNSALGKILILNMKKKEKKFQPLSSVHIIVIIKMLSQKYILFSFVANVYADIISWC